VPVLTIALVLAALGIFLRGLAAFLEVFRPK
jgi:hypothetical protein